MALSHDEANIFTGREDGCLFRWPLYHGSDPKRIRVKASIERIMTVDDGKVVLFSVDGSITILDEGDMHVIASLHGAHSRGIFSGTFDASRNILYTGGLDGWVRAWHFPSLVPIASAKSQKHGVLSLGILPSEQGPLLLAGNVNGNMSLFDPATLSDAGTFRAHEGPLFSIKIVSNEPGNHFTHVSAGSDGTVAIWKGRQGKPLAQIHTGQAKLLDVLLQPTQRGNMFVWTAGGDGSIGAWTLEPAAPPRAGQLACFQVHQRAVEQILFSTRGNCLMSVASDGSMRRMRLAGKGTTQ